MYKEAIPIIYLIITAIITVVVGYNLHSNGYHLILDLFQHKAFTKRINNILLTGYYLVNIGYIATTLSDFGTSASADALTLLLFRKIGIILLILGVLHYHNIFQLQRLSKHRNKLTSMFNS